MERLREDRLRAKRQNLLDCEGKVAFSTWAEGKRAAKRISRRTREPMQCYVCRRCGCVHVGSAWSNHK